MTSVLSVGTHAARTLLIHHRWSVEALFAAYAEHGLDDTLRRAGVLSRADADAAPGASAAAGARRRSESDSPNKGPDLRPAFAASGLVACGTCLNEVPLADVTRMPCGHRFCDECWLGYLRIKVRAGP